MAYSEMGLPRPFHGLAMTIKGLPQSLTLLRNDNVIKFAALSYEIASYSHTLKRELWLKYSATRNIDAMTAVQNIDAMT